MCVCTSFHWSEDSHCLNQVVRNLQRKTATVFVPGQSCSSSLEWQSEFPLLELSRELGVTDLQIITINTVCLFWLSTSFLHEIALDRILIFCGPLTKMFISSYFRVPHEAKFYSGEKYDFFPEVFSPHKLSKELSEVVHQVQNLAISSQLLVEIFPTLEIRNLNLQEKINSFFSHNYEVVKLGFQCRSLIL